MTHCLFQPPLKNTHITTTPSKTSDTYSRPKNDLIHLKYDLIQMKHFINPHTTNILYTNITGDDDSQSFKTPRKHNRNANTQSFHSPLILDSLQCQHNITPNTTRKKLPPFGKEHLFFKLT